jgi:hypothetical protein
MSSLPVPQTGVPELDAVFDEYATRILQLERMVQTLLGAGGRGVAGCFIGTVQAGGISAAVDDDTPGYGTMMLRQVYPTGPAAYGLRDSGIIVPVINIAQGTLGEIAEGKQIATQPILDRSGHQLVILDPCPPT